MQKEVFSHQARMERSAQRARETYSRDTDCQCNGDVPNEAHTNSAKLEVCSDTICIQMTSRRTTSAYLKFGLNHGFMVIVGSRFQAQQ